MTHTVTASAGTGGSISPTSYTAIHGGTVAFTVTPQAGYLIGTVSGCGGSLAGQTYTTGPITADCGVSAGFVEAPNQAPVAVDDSASTAYETAVDVDVLGNDTDPENDALSINGFTQGTNGTVTQVGNSLRYTPLSGFSGTDTFTYTTKDPFGNVSGMATVTVNVEAAPDAPPEFNLAADENNGYATISIENLTGVDGNTVTITWDEGGATRGSIASDESWIIVERGTDSQGTTYTITATVDDNVNPPVSHSINITI